MRNRYFDLLFMINDYERVRSLIFDADKNRVGEGECWEESEEETKEEFVGVLHFLGIESGIRKYNYLACISDWAFVKMALCSFETCFSKAFGSFSALGGIIASSI